MPAITYIILTATARGDGNIVQPPVFEDTQGHLYLDPAQVSWANELVDGRLQIDPTASGGVATEDASGRVSLEPLAFTVSVVKITLTASPKAAGNIVQPPVYEDQQGRLYLDPAQLSWATELADGRLQIDPDTSGSVATEDANGILRIEPQVFKVSVVKKSLTATARSVPVLSRVVNPFVYTVLTAPVRGIAKITRLVSKRAVATAATSARRLRTMLWTRQSSVRALSAQDVVKGFVKRIRKLNLGAYLAGRQGTVIPKIGLWLSNIRGEELKEIKTAEKLSVSLQNGRDHTWEMSLSMAASDTLNPLTDWVKATVDYWNGETWERWPMGLYRMSSPNADILEGTEFWKLAGRSGESLLAEDMSPGSFSIPQGSGVLSQVRTILVTQLSVPYDMIDFPADNEEVYLATPLLFDIAQNTDQCFYLPICNAALTAGGFRRLQTRADGRWVTRKYADPIAYQPDAYYGTAEGHDAIVSADSAITLERDVAEFANKVIVVSNDTTSVPIVAVAENHNPHSPYSIENLGKTVVKTLQLQNVVSVAEANLIASVELSRRSGIFEKLAFQTPLDPRRGPSEIASVSLENTDIEGLWGYEGFAVDLQPTGMMGHDLSRLTPTSS